MSDIIPGCRERTNFITMPIFHKEVRSTETSNIPKYFWLLYYF